MLGQVIHGYRVDRVLSADKGGFGEVFLATHVDSGAEAVVKVLRPEMSANREMVTRFFNEARAAASIHHPGIVQIHNVGYHGDRAYLLMERLRGEDLETRLQAGPLPLDRALVFFRQAVGAVGAAHERGIVHRDLKPANLFIVPDPDVAGGERIKVLDFGIAKLGGTGAVGMTTGVFGTPMYMSPEQCSNSGAVDHRADLYSLGCILYELVCGRPPFGRGGIELIAAHLRDAPPPPRAINPSLPPAIEAVILQLLEKDPARRLQSCSALVTALDAAAAAAGIALGTARSIPPSIDHRSASSEGLSIAALQSAPTRTVPPRSRGRTAVLIGAGVVAAAGAAVAIALVTHREPTVAPAPATVVGTRSSTVDAAVTPATAFDAPTATDEFTERARAAAEDLYAKGKAALLTGKGDFPTASQYLRQSIVSYPMAKAYLALAVSEYQQGHFGEALMSAQAVGQNQPSSKELANAVDLIGKIQAQLRKLGKDPGTGAQLTTAAPVAASPSLDMITRANRLKEQGKHELFASHFPEAVRWFRDSVALDPAPGTYYDLAIAELQMNDLQQALHDAKQVLAHHPDERQTRLATELEEKIRSEMSKQGLSPLSD